MSGTRFLALLAVGATLCGGATLRAGPTPLDLIPADALLCWHSRELPDTHPPEQDPPALQTLLDLGARVAGTPLDAWSQLSLRGVELFGLMVRYPHAVALLDAGVGPSVADPSKRAVSDLKIAVVIATEGKSEPLVRVIQKAVNELASAESAELARRTEGRWSYQELRDRRLPGWAAFSWGELDGLFVLTLGDGVWPAVAATARGDRMSLRADPWCAEVRAARGAAALIEIFAAMKAIRTRLDPLVEGRATDFFREWRAETVDRAYWSFGFKERALFCEAHLQSGSETVRRVFADPDESDPRWLRTIPPEARYAVYRFPMSEFFPRFFGSLAATRGRPERGRIDAQWERVQRDAGIDARRDLLDHLGEHVVLHNDPPHPLRLPLAMTTLTEIRDEPATVRRALDALCEFWRPLLDDPAQSPMPATLHHDADGVWYLRFGLIAGPAWTTTERFIITSWSPTALRQYLEKAGDSIGRRAP